MGIDNGVSGALTLISPSGKVNLHIPTPVRRELSYTKEKKYINRVDVPQLVGILQPLQPASTFCLIERPMVNPGRLAASFSALRALEATLIVLEQLGLAYRYIDSREWQKELLPHGLKGEELKTAAVDVARRLFPGVKFLVNADSLLIAEHGRRKGW